MALKKALFLDRDGTLIEDTGYLNDPAGISYLPGSIEALKKAQRAGFTLVMLTNQSGLSRGIVTKENLESIHEKIKSDLKSEGVFLDWIGFCPHGPAKYTPGGCTCRKPEPGMILEASEKLALEPSESFMVGDKVSDVFCGFNAGCRGSILVLSGYGQSEKDREEFQQRQPDFIAPDLAGAVDWILS